MRLKDYLPSTHPRTLPPMARDKSAQLPVQGHLALILHPLLQENMSQVELRFKFWGEEEDTACELSGQREFRYEVLTSPDLFSKYTKDMGSLAIRLHDRRNSKLVGTAMLPVSEIAKYGNFDHVFDLQVVASGVEKKMKATLQVDVHYEVIKPTKDNRHNTYLHRKESLVEHVAQESYNDEYMEQSRLGRESNIQVTSNASIIRKGSLREHLLRGQELRGSLEHRQVMRPEKRSEPAWNAPAKKGEVSLDVELARLRLQREWLFAQSQEVERLGVELRVVEVRVAECSPASIMDLFVQTPQLGTSLKTRLTLTNRYHFQGVAHPSGTFTFNNSFTIRLPERATEEDFKAITSTQVQFKLQVSTEEIVVDIGLLMSEVLRRAPGEVLELKFAYKQKIKKQVYARQGKIVIITGQIDSKAAPARRPEVPEVPEGAELPDKHEKHSGKKENMDVKTQFQGQEKGKARRVLVSGSEPVRLMQLYVRADRFHLQCDYVSSYFVKISTDQKQWLQSTTKHRKNPRFGFQCVIPLLEGQPFRVVIQLWERGESHRLVGQFKQIFSAVHVNDQSLYPIVLIEGEKELVSDEVAVYAGLCLAVGSSAQINRLAQKLMTVVTEQAPTISPIQSEGGSTSRSRPILRPSIEQNEYINTEEEHSRPGSADQSKQFMRIYEVLNKGLEEREDTAKRREYLQMILSPGRLLE